MRRFSPDELREFLAAVDSHLKGRATMTVVGGGALALGYDVSAATKDIDTYTSISRSLERAIDLAQEETGLDIPVSHSGVVDGPYNFEDRLVRILPHLQHLVVHTLNEHDLAISKILRGENKDFETIGELHEKCALDYDTLVRLYVEETRGSAIGGKRKHDQAFVRLIEELYGDAEAEHIEQQLDAPKRKRRR